LLKASQIRLRVGMGKGVKGEKMKKLFLGITILFLLFSSCHSTPNNSSSKKEPVITLLESVEVDNLYYDEGRKLLSQAVKTYARKYSYYDMTIDIGDIQFLIDKNYEGYKNGFKIYKAEKDFTYYIISAQHNLMNVILFFSDTPFNGSISTRYSWEYDGRYSTGEREKELAEKKNIAEWNRFFESKYNEAILKLSIEGRKVPKDNRVNFRIWEDLQKLEVYKKLKALWFSEEDWLQSEFKFGE